jgi:NAD(P)-dependent dehydrogenase (short-subunit alcohol dehydrogenase family)
MTPTQWSETLRYELDIVFYPAQAAWKHMVQAGGGSIVNVASVSGMMATEKLPAVAHAAAKGGVIAMTRQLAVDGAPHNIRVNSISPGPILTPVTRAALESDPEFRATFESYPRLGRVGEPEDVAYAALYLASDESAWITAINLVVDGGWSG